MEAARQPNGIRSSTRTECDLESGWEFSRWLACNSSRTRALKVLCVHSGISLELADLFTGWLRVCSVPCKTTFNSRLILIFDSGSATNFPFDDTRYIVACKFNFAFEPLLLQFSSKRIRLIAGNWWKWNWIKIRRTLDVGHTQCSWRETAAK